MILQKIRDVALMVPDIFHFILPIWLYRESRRNDYQIKPFYRDQRLKNDIVATSIIVFILLLIWYKIL